MNYVSVSVSVLRKDQYSGDFASFNQDGEAGRVIKVWKMAGKMESPCSMSHYSQCPKEVMKAVFHSSPSLEVRRSNLDKM